MDRATRLAATSESEVVLGVELVDSLVARESGIFRQWLGHLVLGVQCRVDTTLALGGSDEALVSTLGILALVDGEGVITGLGEGVDLRAPAVTAVSPTGDRLALLGSELVEVSKGRSPRLLLAEVGLDPLGSHHDTRLVLLREVDLGLRLSAEEGRTGRERWEAVEWGKARMAAISVGELDRRVGGARRVALGVLRGREGEGSERVVGDGRGRR